MSSKETSFARLLPRLIRFRDAPFYLGMDRNRFNAEARPYLTEIPIGEQGVAFDRLELDTWVEQYKSRNGLRAKAKGERRWQRSKKERPASSSLAKYGTLINGSEVDDFAKALERVASRKPKHTLPGG